MGNEYMGIIRGDTKNISIKSIKYKDGTDYVLKSTDKIYMDIKKADTSSEVLIHKEITADNYVDGVLSFSLYPDETKTLKKGTYVYDVRLFMDEYSIFTIIKESKIIVVNNITEIPEGVSV